MRRIAALTALALAVSSCTAPRPEPRIVDGIAYGVTSAPFRERWWQYYERGVSWARGGFLAEAERDLRACLARRQTDHRRARTYGMHFVQCFAHRELAAVLIELGQLDEAEREARISLAQEPSAKAEHLLQRIAALRAGAVAPDAAPPAAAATGVDLVIERVTAVGDGRLAVVGRVERSAALVAVAGDGTHRVIPIAPDATFAADLAGDESIALAAEDGSVDARGRPGAAVAPRLELDGPADDQVISGSHAWYRFRAASAAALVDLTASDEDDRRIARVALSGVEVGGMVAIAAAPGIRTIRFTVVDADGAVSTAVRRLVFAPRADQDPRLRAVASIVPLAAPVDSVAVAAADDDRFQQALDDDARFRVIDHAADAVLTREARLAEAGWIEPATAADFGRRLRARYVVVATMRRGRGDIECFVRLVHVATGAVVASADAYARVRRDADERAFHAALAARLRQAFPVLGGHARAHGDRALLEMGRNHGVVEGMRFHVLVREADVRDASGAVVLAGAARPIALYEADAVERRAARLVRIDGVERAVGEAVSE
ncbi:MAG TPA: hypothetical protein VEL07_01190 [Planctomycetota bacterium]|nr:hypothetical protein [Planctomycetota bacterium]